MREVKNFEKKSLTIALEQERERISNELYSNPIIAPCSLTRGVIRQLVDHSRYIFDLEDVQKFVSCDFTARCVLRAFADEFEDFSYDCQTTVEMDID